MAFNGAMRTLLLLGFAIALCTIGIGCEKTIHEVNASPMSAPANS